MDSSVAACRGKDTAWWFPASTGGTASSSYAKARAICLACIIRAECLSTCLSNEQNERYRFGMWGGLTPTERERLVRGQKPLRSFVKPSWLSASTAQQFESWQRLQEWASQQFTNISGS